MSISVIMYGKFLSRFRLNLGDAAVVSIGNARVTANNEVPILRLVNVKVKLSLCLTKHHTMKTYRGVEV
jgi:hypothetical protein